METVLTNHSCPLRPLPPLETYTRKDSGHLQRPGWLAGVAFEVRWKCDQGWNCPRSRMVPHLPLGFPVACCLLAFSMACFLCSSVMEKPGGRAHVRSCLAFFNCPCASLEGFLVQVIPILPVPHSYHTLQAGMAGIVLSPAQPPFLTNQGREQ